MRFETKSIFHTNENHPSLNASLKEKIFLRAYLLCFVECHITSKSSKKFLVSQGFVKDSLFCCDAEQSKDWFRWKDALIKNQKILRKRLHSIMKKRTIPLENVLMTHASFCCSMIRWFADPMSNKILFAKLRISFTSYISIRLSNWNTCFSSQSIILWCGDSLLPAGAENLSKNYEVIFYKKKFINIYFVFFYKTMRIL